MSNSEDTTILDENEQIQVRKAKLTALREAGHAFPNHFRRDTLAGDILDGFADKSKEALAEAKHAVVVAGRIMNRRIMGKASFIHLQDVSGKIQVYLKQNDLPEGQYDAFKTWDLGDIVGVRGYLFRTKTGELSIWAEHIEMVTKALRPLPDKFHGLQDHELRARKRYLDLIANEESRKLFVLRSKLIAAVRQFFIDRAFLEVETPMMHTIPGGATARPFATHHNALDMPLYLRVAPELFLKRLVVGGFERVFEINRNFRNEGMSVRHNPEFTMLEFYQAYADYQDLMDLTETLFRYLATQVLGTTVVTYQGHSHDFAKPFARMTLKEAIMQHCPDITEADLDDYAKAKAWAKKLEIPLEPHYGLGKIQLEIFEKVAEHQLSGPTFITAYPAEVSPLARRNDDNPFITDRFEFFIGGREIANGFSELNDPEDQAERFRAQVAELEAGDDEAMHFDEDYVTALEHGMPPTAGEGIGIDRLVMLFADVYSIRDVILFPHMRPLDRSS